MKERHFENNELTVAISCIRAIILLAKPSVILPRNHHRGPVALKNEYIPYNDKHNSRLSISHACSHDTVKILKIGDTIMITVIVVKVEWYGFTQPECIQKGGDGIANSVDPDQTAPRSSLFWVCTVCSDLSVPILRTFTVINCFKLCYL